jgi:hypothetical protein
MKTPREILLQRYRAAEPKLDAARRHALASLERPGIAQSCRDFVFSIRWHLAGMSAVWMAALLLSINSKPDSIVVLAQDKMPSTRALMMALLENRREIIELTESRSASEPVALPPRRSDVQSAVEIV